MRFILSMLSIYLMGFSIINLFFREQLRQKNCLECGSLSFLLGVGCAVCILFFLFITGIPFKIEIILVGPAIAGAISAIYFRKELPLIKLGDLKFPFDSWSWWEKCLLLGITIQVLRSFIYTLPVPVISYDALASYALKAKIFTTSQGIPNGFFHWNEDIITHPDYPLLLPFLLTWVSLFTGFNDVVITWVMPVFFLVFLLFITSQLLRRFDRKAALIGAFIFSTLPQILYYSTIIHADLVFACYVTAGIFYLLRYWEVHDLKSLILSSIMFGLAVWTKSEGMIWAAAFMICNVIFLFKEKRGWSTYKNAALSIFLLILVAGPWISLKFSEHMVNCDVNLSLLTFPKWLGNFRSLGTVFYQFQKEVFNFKKWNMFWLAFFVILVFKGTKRTNQAVEFFGFFLLVTILGYLFGYTLFTGYPVEHYASQTMSRFLVHFVGPFLVLAMYLLFVPSQTFSQKDHR